MGGKGEKVRTPATPGHQRSARSILSHHHQRCLCWQPYQSTVAQLAVAPSQCLLISSVNKVQACVKAPDVRVSSQADSAPGCWTLNPLHFLTNVEPPLQLRAWTTRTVIRDLLCTTWSQAQSSPEHSRLCTAPRGLCLWASLETLLVHQQLQQPGSRPSDPPAVAYPPRQYCPNTEPEQESHSEQQELP